MENNIKKAHFVGIGGIGMSALADILITRGVSVSGSDLRPNNLTDMLLQKGAVIYKGHLAENVPRDVDLAVRSTCIKNDNPEIIKISEMGVRIVPRSEMLRMVMGGFPLSLAVTGTHGKTTTSALAACITDHCGMDPTVLVGGEVGRFGKNARSGSGSLVVAEVDESDGHFREIESTHAVITNIEREHIEHYGSLDEVLRAYAQFAEKIEPSGVLVYNGDDKLSAKIASAAGARKTSFGLGRHNDITCDTVKYKKYIEFDLIRRNDVLTRVRSSLVGAHNLMNILGAVAVALELGLDPEKISEAVACFNGIKRRFDLAGTIGDISVIEDYAHHPTEIRAVISAAVDYSDGRVVTVFQPHRYSRTRDLMDDFTTCFQGSDILVITDIYSADEDPAERMDIKELFDRIDTRGFPGAFICGKESIPQRVADLVESKDTVLVLGAGDIREICGDLVNSIRIKMEKQCRAI